MELDSLEMDEGLKYFCSWLKAKLYRVLAAPPRFIGTLSLGHEAHRTLEGVGVPFRLGNIAVLHEVNATHIRVSSQERSLHWD